MDFTQNKNKSTKEFVNGTIPRHMKLCEKYTRVWFKLLNSRKYFVPIYILQNCVQVVKNSYSAFLRPVEIQQLI